MGYGDIDFFRFVVSRGGNVNKLERLSITLVDRAASQGNIRMMEAVIETGSKWNMVSAFCVAAGQGHAHVLSYLLDRGVSINALPNFESKTQSWIERFGVSNALGTAAWYGELETVQWLIEHGADPNARNTIGQTALDIATKQLDSPTWARIRQELLDCIAYLEKLTNVDGEPADSEPQRTI